jgi:hypothetical protein
MLVFRLSLSEFLVKQGVVDFLRATKAASLSIHANKTYHTYHKICTLAAARLRFRCESAAPTQQQIKNIDQLSKMTSSHQLTLFIRGRNLRGHGRGRSHCGTALGPR